MKNPLVVFTYQRMERREVGKREGETGRERERGKEGMYFNILLTEAWKKTVRETVFKEVEPGRNAQN